MDSFSEIRAIQVKVSRTVLRGGAAGDCVPLPDPKIQGAKMAEPISMLALGAAIGGAAGKFIEKAWDSGEKWITSYYANHKQRAIDKANKNAESFLNKVAEHVKYLEETNLASKERIESAQEEPDFSVLLQKAMIGASQTENEEKHKILARLVSERLQSNAESLISLTSSIACETVPSLTAVQLNILGLSTFIQYFSPSQKMDEDGYSIWLDMNFSYFKGLKYRQIDLFHIEALRCGKYDSMVGRSLSDILKKKNNMVFNVRKFESSEIGRVLSMLWNTQNGLQSLFLTSVGQLIGCMVFDDLRGQRTNLNSWGL